MAEEGSKSGSLLEKLPLEELKGQAVEYGKSLFNSTLGKASDKVEGLTGRMTDFASGNSGKNDGESASSEETGESGDESGGGGEKGKNPLKAVGSAFSWAKNKVTGGGDEGQDPDSDESEDSGKKSRGSDPGAEETGGEKFTGSGAKGNKAQKFVNLVEWIDVGVPVTVAYNQWTQFEEWSDFMKKVENVEFEDQEEAGKIKFKGQVFLSHRQWEATIKEMVPDERIIWKSTGAKGHLDGGVTFHPVGPRLTRICIVVEYFPQGFFEKTGQIWRAVGRRVRVEMKRYVRHVMTTTILDPDSVEGWRAEIRDEEIVRTHEEVVEAEQAETEEPEEGEEPEDGEGDEEAEEQEDGEAEEGEAEYEEEEPDADTEEGGEDEEYEEDPESAEDSESDDEAEYEEEPEAAQDVADEDENVEYEDESDSSDAEEPADEEEEPSESAEPDEEPAEEVAEDAERSAEDSEEAEEEPERPRRKRK